MPSDPCVPSNPVPGLDTSGFPTERWYDADGRPHRNDGPAFLTYYVDGPVKAEIFFVHGARHRIGAPAERRLYETGDLIVEKWYRADLPHRVDGPAKTSFDADGTVVREYYRFRGFDVNGPAGLATTLCNLTPADLTAEYRDSSYRALLDEGIAAATVLDVFALGVSTAEGIREVLAGAPVEWVASWESGALVRPGVS